MTDPHYTDASVTLWHGDCLDVMRNLPDNSVDAVVTDPPAGIAFMSKDWDTSHGGRDQFVEWLSVRLTECTRVLKPGGHAIIWALPRTTGWTQRAIEDAGLIPRDCIHHMFGSGFPKGSRLNMDARWCQCASTAHTSSHTSPEPQHGDHTRTAAAEESAVHAKRSAQHGLRTASNSRDDCHPGCGFDDAPPRPASEGDRSSVPLQADALGHSRSGEPEDVPGHGPSRSPSQALCSGLPSSQGSAPPASFETATPANTSASKSPADTSESAPDRSGNSPGFSPAQHSIGFPLCMRCGKPNGDGWNVALKPAVEHWHLARKPLSEPTVAANVLRHGTGALNIDASRVGAESRPVMVRTSTVIQSSAMENPSTGGTSSGETTTQGRWPANVVLTHAQCEDGGDACADGCVPGCPVTELDAQSGTLTGRIGMTQHSSPTHIYGEHRRTEQSTRRSGIADSGGASRFFHTFRYEPKAPTTERPRDGRISHPTVKSLDLMRFLVRLVTPPKGTCLDPFAGSGTTAEACVIEGFKCIAIEREPAYLPLIVARLTKPIQPDLFGGGAA